MCDRSVRSESAIGECDRSAIGLCSEYRNIRMPVYQMAGPGAGDPAPGPAAGTGPGSRAGPGKKKIQKSKNPKIQNPNLES